MSFVQCIFRFVFLCQPNVVICITMFSSFACSTCFVKMVVFVLHVLLFNIDFKSNTSQERIKVPTINIVFNYK